MKMPRLLAGGGGWLLGRICAYGIGHAAAAFWLSRLVHRAVHPETSQGPDGWLLLGLAGTSALIYGLRVLEAGDAEALGQNYVLRVRRRLLRNVGEGSGPGRSEAWGVTMNRMVTDLGALKNWVSAGQARIVSSGVAIVGLAGAIAWIAPSAIGAMVSVALITLLGVVLLVPRLRTRIRSVRRFRGRLARRLGDGIRGAPTLRFFQAVRSGSRAVDRISRRLKRESVHRARLSAALRRFPELAYGPGIAVLLLHVWSQTTTTVTLPAVLLLGFLVASVRDLFQALDYRLAYLEARRRLEGLPRRGLQQDRNSPIKELGGTGPVSVVFDSVVAVEGLASISFEVPSGTCVHLTGGSGAGKTACLRASSGLVHPLAGNVAIDGVPLSQILNLHQVVHLVSPELPLIRGTVKDNLKIPCPGASAEEVAFAADLVGLPGDPALSADGLETAVGDGGGNLPSGSVARILLARAVVARPRLLLIDEASGVAREDLRSAFEATVKHLGATVVFAGTTAPSWLRVDRTIRIDVAPAPVTRQRAPDTAFPSLTSTP